MIELLIFGETQIIGRVVPYLIAFGLFLGAIGYFASRGKWQKCSAGKTRINSIEITAGIGKRLLEFVELVRLLLDGDLLLSN